MITYQYSSTGYRPLEKIKGLKIIDVGGYTSFADGFLDAIIDIRKPQAKAENIWVGDINMPEIWNLVSDHVEKNGKWDYCICSGTLEDIYNPLFVCRMMEQIASAGFIYVPSRYRELARFSGSTRGFMHHLWIFTMIAGIFTGFPKINYVEDVVFDDVHLGLEGKEELLIEWRGEIGMRIVNDGMPYGTEKLSGEEHIKILYKQLL